MLGEKGVLAFLRPVRCQTLIIFDTLFLVARCVKFRPANWHRAVRQAFGFSNFDSMVVHFSKQHAHLFHITGLFQCFLNTSPLHTETDNINTCNELLCRQGGSFTIVEERENKILGKHSGLYFSI